MMKYGTDFDTLILLLHQFLLLKVLHEIGVILSLKAKIL